MSDQPKPKPYKFFCDAHQRQATGPNRCPICFGAEPNPVNDEPVQKANTTSSVTKPPETGGFVQQNIAEPAFSDPTALKVVEAAQNYARALEAVNILTEQLKEARELVKAFETKLKETKAMAESAQTELRNATIKKEAVA